MKRFVASLALLAVLVGSVSQTKGANLVTNGSFEQNGGVGELAGGISYATGWTVGATTDGSQYPFAFIVNSSADSSGFPSVFSPSAGTNIYLWGPNTPASHGGPSPNGFTGSPDGGYFLGVDGGYATAPVSQTINGLTPGSKYTLSFQWAASQFTDASLPTTQDWQVSLGGDTVTTTPFNLPGKGFSGWMNYSHTFTATSSSEVLSFLSQGGIPNALPPFALLDGVSLTPAGTTATPEPSTFALLGTAAASFAGFWWRRRKQLASA